MNPWIRVPLLVVFSPLLLLAILCVGAAVLLFNLIVLIDSVMMNEPIRWQWLP